MCAQTCLWACARGRCGSPCAVELVASKYLRKQASRERDPPSLLRSPVEGVARSLSCHTRARDGSGDKRHARARVWWYRVRPRKWDSTLIHLTVPTGVSAPHSAHASQPPLTCPERARTPKPGRAGAQGVPQHRGATRGGIKTGGATHKAARTALSRPARPLQQRHFFCTLVRKTAHKSTGGEKISWQDGIPRQGPSHAAAVRRRSSPIGNPHGHSPWLCGNPTAASGLEGVEE